MMSTAPLSLKFKVTGMDCAACARKIETAVGRIPGASGVTVGVTSETLSVTLAEPERESEIARTVKSLGYGISGEAPASDHSGQAQGDHDGHTRPIEGSWWQSPKGRLVLLSGGLIAAAYLATLIVPQFSLYVFLAACIAGAIPVVRRAVAAARSGAFFTIEMLMTVAVVGAVIIGATEEAALVVFLFAVGELLEGIAAGRARSGIKALADIAPKTAMVETQEGLVETPIEAIAVGAIIVVRPGDRVPADATVISGVSALDESALTGESIPKVKEPGDRVLAGSINSEAMLHCRVEAEAKDTLIARVVKLVEEAADAEAPTERFIDAFSRYYMPAICALALAVALVPPLALGADWWTWIYRALALLLIGCPCALVISTPAAIASALAAGARRGLLVKGGGVLEAIGKVSAIAFDKTGTLTEGRPSLVAVEGPQAGQALRLAAALEASSEHPLGRAIVEAAEKAGGARPAVEDFRARPGYGVEGRVEGRRVLVGARRFLEREGVVGAEEEGGLRTRASALESEGATVVFVAADGLTLGILAIADRIKPEAAALVHALEAHGLHVALVTGDARRTAASVAAKIGIEDVHAEVLPEDKARVVHDLQRDGRRVAFVGDGINDAPALAQADVGIALAGSTDIAVEAADVTLTRGRLGEVFTAWTVARRTLGNIRGNLFWAFFYNILLIPIAAGVAVPFGVHLNPMLAGVAMGLSSIFVLGNSLRLKRLRAWDPKVA